MASRSDDLRAMRDALYRPGATEEDRQRYEAVAAQAVAAQTVAVADASVSARIAPRGRRRRARAIGIASGALAVAAGATAIVVARAVPPYPTVTAAPIELLGGAADRAGAAADLRALFTQRDPFLGLYLARHRTTLSASLRSDSIAVDGHGTGPAAVSLVGILSDESQATGLLTVLFVCDRPGTAWSWMVEGPPDSSGRPVRTGASGGDCGGAITTATWVPRPHHVPTRIRISVPAGVRFVVEADLSKY